jgi:glycosyltransferase involved in cell wall biosynthesis
LEVIGNINSVCDSNSSSVGLKVGKLARLRSGSNVKAQKRRRKLLFFVTEDWYFWSHRLPIALAARDAGYEVVLVTRVSKLRTRIENEGIRVIPIDIRRSSLNPLLDMSALFALVAIYRRERPDVAHHVAVKPVLYGSLASKLTGIRRVVNALAGLGFLFVSSGVKARLLRPAVRRALRWALRGDGHTVILQNPQDVAVLASDGLCRRNQVHLIRGSGVDLTRFCCVPEAFGPKVVILAARMLWDKGVGEFVEAAKHLQAQGVEARFVLVGETDLANPAAVPDSQLRIWASEGVVECWGRREDMPEVLAAAHVVCLPSYGEGVPKILIEAAAVGRAIVATDISGCREIVREGENGLLVPPRDVDALVLAIKRLLDDDELRARFGARSREIAESEFGIEKVVNETLEVYDALFNGGKAGNGSIP